LQAEASAGLSLAPRARLAGVGSQFGLQSKPIHRRPAHQVQLAIQQGHPVQRLAAGQRQVAQGVGGQVRRVLDAFVARLAVQRGLQVPEV